MPKRYNVRDKFLYWYFNNVYVLKKKNKSKLTTQSNILNNDRKYPDTPNAKNFVKSSNEKIDIKMISAVSKTKEKQISI